MLRTLITNAMLLATSFCLLFIMVCIAIFGDVGFDEPNKVILGVEIAVFGATVALAVYNLVRLVKQEVNK